MLQHYLIIAIRNFFKYKLQTVISITGLAIGLVCFAYGINWLMASIRNPNKSTCFTG